MTLDVDEARWHHSWSADPGNPTPIEDLLARSASYGFSFVGFTAEVTGRMCMSEFSIAPA